MNKNTRKLHIEFYIKNIIFIHHNQDVGMGWFKIFNIGIHWKDVNKWGYNYAEVYKIKKTITIGSWCFTIIKNYD